MCENGVCFRLCVSVVVPNWSIVCRVCSIIRCPSSFFCMHLTIVVNQRQLGRGGCLGDRDASSSCHDVRCVDAVCVKLQRRADTSCILGHAFTDRFSISLLGAPRRWSCVDTRWWGCINLLVLLAEERSSVCIVLASGATTSVASGAPRLAGALGLWCIHVKDDAWCLTPWWCEVLARNGSN